MSLSYACAEEESPKSPDERWIAPAPTARAAPSESPSSADAPDEDLESVRRHREQRAQAAAALAAEDKRLEERARAEFQAETEHRRAEAQRLQEAQAEIERGASAREDYAQRFDERVLEGTKVDVVIEAVGPGARTLHFQFQRSGCSRRFIHVTIKKNRKLFARLGFTDVSCSDRSESWSGEL